MAQEFTHQIYIHIDPGSRELLYVGVSFGKWRPVDFSARSGPHRERLMALMTSGWKRDQIVRIAASGMRPQTARNLEKQVIGVLRPRFNQRHNPASGFAMGDVA